MNLPYETNYTAKVLRVQEVSFFLYQTLSKERSRQFQTSIRPVALCSNVQYLKQIPADLLGQDFQDLRRLSPIAGIGISSIEQGTSNVEVCFGAPFDYAQGMLGALVANGQLKKQACPQQRRMEPIWLFYRRERRVRGSS